MSPTVFIWRGYRFFFFSREETRPHVHVKCGDGEAKFWLDPDIELAKNLGLTAQQVSELRKVIQERRDELSSAWQQHFS